VVTLNPLSQDSYISYCGMTYRLLLDCMARPGTITQLLDPTMFDTIPGYVTPRNEYPPNRFAIGTFMTLLDKETTYIQGAQGAWLAADELPVRWMALRTNSRPVEASSAAFAFLWDDTSSALLRELSPGTLVYPERSASAFICVDMLASAAPVNEGWHLWELSGPGIENRCQVALAGITPSLLADIQATRQAYPLGIDVFLIDRAGQCIGLPRTTRILQR
jgi:alpha-D-ribose 1-methylphosphonate 5-triphosphate synthase subunit PhnH